MLTAAEIAAMEHNIDNVWSLADYLNDMNTRARAEMAANPGLWVSEMTEDLSHWAEIEVYTARDLANYLDACFQREVQKSQYDFDMDDFQAGQAAGLAAGAAEAPYEYKPDEGHATLADLFREAGLA